MNKQDVISEIIRIAEQDKKPPGMQRFSSETGIAKSEWYPKMWLRWSDAIQEAGLNPNVYNKAFDKNFLISKLIAFTRELGHLPIEGELRNKSKSDSTFPSHNALRQLGSKQDRVRLLAQCCEGKSDYADVLAICTNVPRTSREGFDNLTSIDFNSSAQFENEYL